MIVLILFNVADGPYWRMMMGKTPSQFCVYSAENALSQQFPKLWVVTHHWESLLIGLIINALKALQWLWCHGHLGACPLTETLRASCRIADNCSSLCGSPWCSKKFRFMLRSTLPFFMQKSRVHIIGAFHCIRDNCRGGCRSPQPCRRPSCQPR